MPLKKTNRPKRRRGRTVGLLGGSFNPAHEGHLHISQAALKQLRLDQVWWMVSPQNPLKSADGMADFQQRLSAARQMACDPRIRVTDIESRLRTTHTARTLEKLTQAFPEVRFVWLMGADNLAQIHRWHWWQKIFTTVPLAVFARPSYDSNALAGVAATRFARFKVPVHTAPVLAEKMPPAWVFLAIRRHAASATAIRASGGFPASGNSNPDKPGSSGGSA